MNGYKGFTLLELITCCTLIAILTSLSLSGLQLLNQWRLKTATEQLFQQLQSARSLALQRHKPTIVCATQDQTHCTKNWSQGVAVLIDENENSQADESDTMVFSVQFEAGIQVKWKAFQNKSFLAFTPEGFTDHQNGRFYLCMPESGKNLYRQIIVNKSGRARLVLSPDGAAYTNC